MNQPAFAGAGSRRLRRRRQAESPSSGWSSFASLLRRQEQSSSLDSIVYEAQQIASGEEYPSSYTAYSAAAQAIMDGTTAFGTYCVTVSSSAGPVADMGLTLNGPNYQVQEDEPPCRA